MNDVISPGLIVPSGSIESQRSQIVVAPMVTGYNHEGGVIAYGRPGLRSGPEAASVVRQGGDLVVRYRNVTDGLHGYSANQVIGFETCAGDTCSYAPALPQGDNVVLTGANRPGVTRVRYAWADAPFVNLFDGADLPAAPFVLPVQ